MASLETLNHSVLKAMGYTKKVSGCRCPVGSEACVQVWCHIFPRASLTRGVRIGDDECWVGLAWGSARELR